MCRRSEPWLEDSPVGQLQHLVSSLETAWTAAESHCTVDEPRGILPSSKDIRFQSNYDANEVHGCVHIMEGSSSHLSVSSSSLYLTSRQGTWTSKD